jgi:RHS repeat-associated protein
VDASGNLVGQVRYTAFGEIRAGFSGAEATDYEYTGQLSKMDTVGLLFYKARWMDPVTAHFASADTLVPDLYNPQSWDRFSYVRNNPIHWT